MPNINDLRESKYLSKADCGNGILVTIAGCEQRNVAMDSQPPEMKWVLMFQEDLKPMVLNFANGQLIAQITGSENTEDWVGQQIVLYNDKSIMFQGRLTGGIRARAPRMPAAPPQRQPVARAVQGQYQQAPAQARPQAARPAPRPPAGYAPPAPPPQHAYPAQEEAPWPAEAPDGFDPGTGQPPEGDTPF